MINETKKYSFMQYNFSKTLFSLACIMLLLSALYKTLEN